MGEPALPLRWADWQGRMQAGVSGWQGPQGRLWGRPPRRECLAWASCWTGSGGPSHCGPAGGEHAKE
eukprot:1147992-Pelagomonas_calceolata.AAC.7